MKQLVFLFALIFSASVSAQTAREDIKADINKSGSNHCIYLGPQKKLSPAPKGKTPFYISHYGRHGSRYLCGKNEYTSLENVLLKADKYGKLTAEGKEVLRKVVFVCNEAHNRAGELTDLGAAQHKGIAKRMYERFPEVFADSACIDAKSTVVIRCILSMENALHQFLVMNPKLKIRHDASEHDMYYMNFGNDWIEKYRMTRATREQIAKWTNEHCSPDRLMKVLFNDKDYVRDSLRAQSVYFDLFKVASIIQGCESRHQIDLMSIFTEDEVYYNWERNNISWFMSHTGNAQNLGLPPYIQRNLLRNIIHQADSCIMIEKPGATLRYGHETMVLPLSSLLELNNNCQPISDVTKVTENWQNYKVFPMAANVQFIFYRKDINDKDVLVKVLLNEDEATMPIATDCAPYYHWKDVRAYYINKLDTFEKNMPKLKEEASKIDWGRFW